MKNIAQIANRFFKAPFYVFIAASIFLSGFLVFGNTVQAAGPCEGAVGSPLLVDATQNITNDVDSGLHGNWALDNYTRHIQVWLDENGTTYCDRVDYNGTFNAPAGVLSPQMGLPLSQNVNGTMVGGYTQAITGATSSVPIVIPSDLDYGGTLGNIATWTQALLPKAYSSSTSAKWQDEVFAPGYTAAYINGGNGWSWTYTSSLGEIWTNAGTGNTGDISHSIVNSNTHIGYSAIQDAINTATSSDTIVLGADATTTLQININKAITIDGNGHTLHASFAKTDNTNNSAIGITHSDVTIKNLIVDGTGSPAYPTQLHGINIYESTGVNLDTVSVSNFGGSGVVVNGSTVTATNLNTSGNTWNAVNVDPGDGVTTASVFNLNSGTLSESTQIWSDGVHVGGSATMSVAASGYNKYVYAAGGANALVWTSRALTNAATITRTVDGVATTTLYTTIQAAINAASTTTPETINVAAGTYNEAVTINKSVTLVGDIGDSIAGPGSSAPLLDGQSTLHDAFTISAGVSGVTIKGFEIANYVGPGNGVGNAIQAWNSGTSNIEISDNYMHDLDWNGVLVGNDGALGDHTNWTIKNNIVANYKAYGLELTNASNSSFEDNVVHASSSWTSILVVARRDEAGITIKNNLLDGSIESDPTAGGRAAIYILGWGHETPGAQLSSVMVENNQISTTGTRPHVRVREVQTGQVTGVTVKDNTLSTLENLAVAQVAATPNYWGTVSSTEIAANVSGTVIFDPWYINPGRTVLNTAVTDNKIDIPSGNFDMPEIADGQVSLPAGTFDLSLGNDSLLDFSQSANIAAGGNINIGGTSIPLNNFSSGDLSGIDLSTAKTIGDQAVTVDKAIKLSSGSSTAPIVITNTALPSVNASIPDGTTILAPSGWTGTIQPPKTATGSGDAPSGFSIGGTVIEVGSPGAVLLFDKPVTLTLAGVTGAVGYKPAGSNTWVQITNTCSGDYANPTAPTFPGECAVSAGGNTKIVTYHFTTFGSLTPTPAPAPTPAPSAGGGGGGGGGFTGIPWDWNPNVPAAPAAAQRPAGQVLGTATFNFANNLKLGLQSNDVSELQKRLTSEGVYSGPITGYFGPLTQKAVKAYQAKLGISATGVVGPLTRAQLNGSQVAGASTTNTEALKAQIASLQAQLVILLQQLKQILQSQTNQ